MTEVTASYKIGQATVANGGAVITGIGTAWSAWIRPGDTFEGGDGSTVEVALVTDDAHLVLLWPWPGASQTAGNYRILYAPGSARATEKAREAVEALKIPQTGMPMVWDGTSITDGNPGGGRVRGNHATTPTVLFVSKADARGGDISGRLATFAENTVLTYRPTDGANAFLDFDVSAAITDAGTYVKVPVLLVAGAVPADRAALAMAGTPSGKDGAVVGTPAGAYAAGTTYSKGQYVTDQNSSWVYINATPGAGHAPPTLPAVVDAYWQLLTAQGAEGAQGPSGIIGNWRGQWVTGTAYALKDAVSNGGSGYLCVTAHTSGTFATDLAAGRWELSAAKGDAGGLEIVPLPSANADTLTTAGIYSTPGNGTFTGSPYPGADARNQGWIWDYPNDNPDYAVQIFISLQGLLQVRTKVAGTWGAFAPLGGGDSVSGPAGAIDGHVAVFDGGTGNILKDGGALVAMAPQSVLSSTLILDATAFGQSFQLSAATDFTVTLPAPNAGNEGQMIYFEADTASGLPTLASAALIDGAASRTMWSGETALLRSTGSSWRKVAGVTKPLVGILYNSVAQTGITISGSAVIQLDSASAGGGIACHDATNKRFLARRAGWYDIDTNVPLTADSGLTTAILWLVKNGTGLEALGGRANYTSVSSNVMYGTFWSAMINLGSGDYVNVMEQPIGSPVNYRTFVDGGSKPTLRYREIPQW